MGTVRDFTDTKINELKELVRETEAQDDWLFGGLGDIMSDWFISESVAQYGEDIKAYHQAILDKRNTSEDDIDTIVEAVKAVDAEYGNLIKAQRELLAGLVPAIKNLSELLNSSSPNFSLTLPPEEFQAKLSEATAPLLQRVIDSLVDYDDEGNPTYNWEEIERITSKEAQEITEEEYRALALLYMEMEVESVQTFLMYLADEVRYESIVPIPPDYSSWTYDADKITQLQTYIGLGCEMLLFDYSVLQAYSDDEVIALYQECYPGVDISSLSAQNMRDTLSRELEADHNRYLQNSALLSVVADLGAYTDSAGGLGYLSNEFPGLNGVSGAAGPTITLKLVENSKYSSKMDYEFVYHNTQQSTVSGSGGGVVTILNHMHANAITIGATLAGADGESYAQELSRTYIAYLNNYSPAGTLTSGASSIVAGIALDHATERISQRIANKTVRAVVGTVPIIGDGVALGLEIGSETAENQKEQTRAQGITSSSLASELASRAGMSANFISVDDIDHVSAIVSPGWNTYAWLEDLNAYLATDLDLQERILRSSGEGQEYEGLTYPLTIDQLYGCNASVINVIDALPEDVRNRFNPSEGA